jgi:polar amino acid transport system substrate-binding protein
LFGVSVDLALALARSLGVPAELVGYDAAGKAVAGMLAGDVDVGFFAHDPVRAEHIAQTAPYVLMEGCYLVRDASPIHDNADVDRAGVRVAVGLGSAYDLYLTRTLRAAEIVRAPTSPTVVATFLDQDLDVAAGVRQQIEADAAAASRVRLLLGRFMVIEQAMAIRKDRGPAATDYLEAFVAAYKASGFVTAAPARHRIEGASVAP